MQGTNRNRRLFSVDLMRSLAICTMMLIHFSENLAPAPKDLWLYRFFHFLSESIAAPFFAFLVGFSCFISVKNSGVSNESLILAQKRTFKRGVMVCLIGFLFGLTAWWNLYVFEWDILPLIGFSLIVLSLLLNSDERLHLVLALSVVFVSPLLQSWCHFFSAWEANGLEYKEIVDFSYILLGFLVRGFFPVFPWVAYPLIGFACAKAVFKGVRAGNVALLGIVGFLSVMLGVALMVAAKSFHTGTLLDLYVTNWTISYAKYPLTVSFFCFSIGLAMVSFSLLYFLFDTKAKDAVGGAWRVAVERFSKYSLSIYVFHHCLHLWPLFILGWLRQGDKDAYYGELLSFPQAIVLGCLCVILCHFGVKIWDAKGGKYGMEWMLKRSLQPGRELS